ncbi:hypothetical protein GCM10007895_00570 [Paraferrimonas sedimenticola]|uniref:Uncharacterized protein n=1 Tax=Paraferrimonas sedimenticola TaxID=375674 RepID=A0AA37VSL9_9GAMM|nr:hypothetical protein [Paraferrimonas sedimenticola]GLP94751.1 hypothetical protein GCM10007895_00570 [Paraferrimonas sedimenticola]
MAGEAKEVYDHGQLSRDFTYIDDTVAAIMAAMQVMPEGEPESGNFTPYTSSAPYQVFNIGHHRPVPLWDFIRSLENTLGRRAKLELKAMQQGDVYDTYASTE